MSQTEPQNTRDHNHHPLATHTYHNSRTQSDMPCRVKSCDGIARVTMYYAPDTGMNWVQCCCCGEEWNPGSVRYTRDPRQL